MQKRSILLIFLILSGLLIGETTLTLQDAITLAMRHNHQILVTKINAQIAENNANIGNAGLLPKLDLIAGATYQDTKIDPNSGSFQQSGSATSNNARILATYTLFDGFGNIYRMKQLNTVKDIARMQTRANIEQTLFQVSTGYYNTALAIENKTIAAELLDISQERLQRAKERNRFGQAGQIQLLSAQVDLNTDSITFINTLLALETATRSLNVFLGQSPETPLILDPQVQFTESRDLSVLLESAAKNNAGYQSALFQTIHARQNLYLANCAYSPRVDLNTSYGYTHTENAMNLSLNNPDKTFSAGASISLNLFNGFQSQIRRKNAALTLESSKIYLQEAELELEKSVRNAYSAYQQSRYILQTENRNLQAAELNFQRMNDLFRLGQVTNTQFREAQLNLIRAKNRISTARYDAKLNEIKILKLTGELIQ